jgi:predicted RNase H-like HicB family nuclease
MSQKRGKMTQKHIAIIERDGDGYVSMCPELDIASQGDTVEGARENLKEALELFFETASPNEIAQRLHGDIFITQVEIAVG